MPGALNPLLESLYNNKVILGIGNCEAKKRCKEYAKNSGGNRSDAYSHCMERENNIKNYGDLLISLLLKHCYQLSKV